LEEHKERENHKEERDGERKKRKEERDEERKKRKEEWDEERKKRKEEWYEEREKRREEWLLLCIVSLAATPQMLREWVKAADVIFIIYFYGKKMGICTHQAGEILLFVFLVGGTPWCLHSFC
jgi:hypothetical protein